jgi:malonyl-CoA/methylmalonyl-CoA synthetase
LRDLASAASPMTGIETRAETDLAAILYTSGTTGKSKGAMITHGNLSSNIAALHETWAFEPGDVLLHALPIYHVHGLFVALGVALYNASPIIWLPKFDADEVVRLLPSTTVMMGVPTFYTRLLDHPRFDAALVKHMRLFVAGSAPLLAETHRAFFERTGHHILERYGMTETGMITSNPYGGERIAGTVGYPLPGVHLRIAGSDGGEAPTGEPGVIEVKGPNVFTGYWRMPEKTREEFRDDGYFITGDIGVKAPDGRVSIVGRAKDLIITGGFNVYPKEIEAEIDAMAGVIESAVVGVQHPDFGEGVIAVVAANGAAPDEAAVIGALQGKMAKFKLPKRVFFVGDLPRNAMGKVQKAELRLRYAATFKTDAKPQ